MLQCPSFDGLAKVQEILHAAFSVRFEINALCKKLLELHYLHPD